MKLRKALVASAVLTAITTISNPINAQSICQPCPAGSFANTSTNNRCKACEEGWFCPGSMDRQQCTMANSTTIAGVGFVGDSNYQMGATNAAECSCTVGHYFTGSSCLACPGGTYKNATNHRNTSCHNCEAGHMCLNNTRRACSGADEYQDQTGQSACKSCPAGLKVSNTQCKTCQSGYTYYESRRFTMAQNYTLNGIRHPVAFGGTSLASICCLDGQIVYWWGESSHGGCSCAQQGAQCSGENSSAECDDGTSGCHRNYTATCTTAVWGSQCYSI